jgi:hypothetical protein
MTSVIFRFKKKTDGVFKIINQFDGVAPNSTTSPPFFFPTRGKMATPVKSLKNPESSY